MPEFPRAGTDVGSALYLDPDRQTCLCTRLPIIKTASYRVYFTFRTTTARVGLGTRQSRLRLLNLGEGPPIHAFDDRN